MRRWWISSSSAPIWKTALGYADGAKGGRPAYDPVLMFKILVIQAQNGLSDDKAEFLINDPVVVYAVSSGLGLSDRVPDAKTIWMFRERLTRADAIDGLFRRLDKYGNEGLPESRRP